MTRTTKRQSRRLLKIKQFKEFVFISDSANNSVSNSTKQLHNNINNAIAQAKIEDSLKITQIETSKDITNQLKSLQIKIGAIVRLINKTNNGSVVVSLDNRLIGMGAEIAHQISAVRVS